MYVLLYIPIQATYAPARTSAVYLGNTTLLLAVQQVWEVTPPGHRGHLVTSVTPLAPISSEETPPYISGNQWSSGGTRYRGYTLSVTVDTWYTLPAQVSRSSHHRLPPRLLSKLPIHVREARGNRRDKITKKTRTRYTVFEFSFIYFL